MLDGVTITLHTSTHVRHSLHLQKWLFMYDSENDGSGNSHGIPSRYTLPLLLLHGSCSNNRYFDSRPYSVDWLDSIFVLFRNTFQHHIHSSSMRLWGEYMWIYVCVHICVICRLLSSILLSSLLPTFESFCVVNFWDACIKTIVCHWKILKIEL